jgi:activating molecule in BECN1-regulated autophagy protein 1
MTSSYGFHPSFGGAGGQGRGDGGDNYYRSSHNFYDGDRLSGPPLPRPPPPPAPVPDRDTMEGRWAFREACRRETADHRRVIPGGESAISLARNVAHVLSDRELHGSRTLVHRRLPLDQRYHCATTTEFAIEGGGTGCASSREGGGRSPLTVFESPISTTTSPAAYDRDDSKLSTAAHNDRKRSAPVAVEAPMRQAHENEDDSVCRTRERIRKVCYPMTVSKEVQAFGEHCSALKYQSTFLHHLGGDDELDEAGNRPPSSRAVSTISVAFSPDAMTMASTHGDHTVKITCCNSGLLLQSLEGHPRTPWTVKYHPTNSDVLASGCLGHQVRVWNWRERQCLRMVRLEFAIISLSFHPSGKVLAVANGTRLHFWGVDSSGDGSISLTAGAGAASGSGSERRIAALTEMDQRHMLRCVHFPPDGRTIIIGGVNPATDEARRRQRTGAGASGMSFYLRLWDFDLDRALHPQSDINASGNSIAQRPISNVRCSLALFAAPCLPFFVLSHSPCP